MSGVLVPAVANGTLRLIVEMPEATAKISIGIRDPDFIIHLYTIPSSASSSLLLHFYISFHRPSTLSLCPSFCRPLLSIPCISGKLPFLTPVSCLLKLALDHAGSKSTAYCRMCCFSSTGIERPKRYGNLTVGVPLQHLKLTDGLQAVTLDVGRLMVSLPTYDAYALRSGLPPCIGLTFSHIRRQR